MNVFRTTFSAFFRFPPTNPAFTSFTNLTVVSATKAIFSSDLKIDKLKGFKVGADDYVTKPVDEELLLAKIRAIIKRSTGNKKVVQDEFLLGNYQFTFSLQTLDYQGETTHLTQRESELLRLLCQYENQLMPRKKALQEIWGATDEFSRKSMDVFISHLRKYLAKDARIQISNVHGKGFVFSVKN